jgi:hypothetical protein
MSDSIEYKEGDHLSFITYLFSKDPPPENSIVLESPPQDPHKNIGLHMFEQLLMIFVDGLKYKHGDSFGKVDVHTLQVSDIDKMKLYFKSIGYTCEIQVFDTIHDYQFRYPDYFKYKDTITPHTKLHDFFYEIFGTQNRVFRVSFSM